MVGLFPDSPDFKKCIIIFKYCPFKTPKLNQMHLDFKNYERSFHPFQSEAIWAYRLPTDLGKPQNR
mgnify:CR=1 FL=1